MPSKGKINQAPTVHAALAAAMSDPGLLDRWRRDPLALRDVSIDERQFDLEQVRNFIGLVTKVRHNDLRAVLPATFKLMDKASLSIPLFADYALKAVAIRSNGKPTAAEKIEALADYLNGWLDKENAVHCLVWDLFRHEHSILMLRQSKQAPRTPSVIENIGPRSVPRRNGMIFHHEMTCRPSDVETMLLDVDCDLKAIPRRRSLYAYFGDEQSARLRISEIDEATFAILDLADGYRDVGKVAAVLRKAGVAVKTQQLCEMVGELVSSGMLAAEKHTD